jgi:ferredoxin
MPTVSCENINRRIPAEEGENLLQVLEREGVRIYRWPRGYLQSRSGTVLALAGLLAIAYPLAPTAAVGYLIATLLGLAILVRLLFSRAFDSSFVEIKSGMDHLSDRTGRERKALHRKPETYRLASECFIHGDVTLATLPTDKVTEEYW